MPDHETSRIIRPRALIRYLGALTGVVAGAPSWFGIAGFLLNPQWFLTQPAGAGFAFTLGLGIGYTTYRWVTIRGEADPRLIRLRGWFRTLTVSPQELAEIREMVRLTRKGREPYYELFDARGESLGTVPAALMFCKDWEEFLSFLRRQANDRANKSAGVRRERGLEDKPASEWTAEDLERYERE